MPHFFSLRAAVSALFILFVTSIMAGCPSKAPDRVETEKPQVADVPADVKTSEAAEVSAPADKAEASPSPEETDANSESEASDAQAPDQPPDLGPPLVENAESLKRLEPDSPVWLDAENKRVVMIGQVCQTGAPLEMFACLRNTKEHESILVVPVRAYIVHAGLLAVGAKAGHPVQFVPKYMPATGTIIEIEVLWKDKSGKIHSARGQDWVRNVKTGKAMDADWVFGGSGFWEDETTGLRRYQAEGGDFICVSNFTTAMLDISVESSQSNTDLMFDAFTERIPPRGTPVTIVLTPKPEENGRTE